MIEKFGFDQAVPVDSKHLIEMLRERGFDVRDEMFEAGYALDHVMPIAMPTDRADEDMFTIEDPAFLGIRFGFCVEIPSRNVSLSARAILKAGSPDRFGVRAIDFVMAAQRNARPVIKSYEELGVPGIAEHGLSGMDVMLWAVTTEDKISGAGALISPKLPYLIKEKIGTDKFYLIPSSIHELIVVPEFDGMSDSFITNMLATVMLVNAILLPKEDFLTDNVFHYDGTRFSTVLNTF